jgi:DNA-binding MarR family transcriptional regulator
MGPKGREGSEGMGLLEREPDLLNLRQVRYRLSDRGMVLAKRVGAIAMGRESPTAS